MGTSSMSYAAMFDRVEVLNLLLKRRADINEGSPASFGVTPLHAATAYGKHRATELLLERRADANAITEFGASPLHVLCFSGSAELADLLLAHHADVNQLHTPVTARARWMIRAAFVKRALGISVLASHQLVEAQDANPVGAAALVGMVELSQVLMDAHADAEHRNAQGNSAIDLAKRHGQSEALLQVLSRQRSVRRTSLRLKSVILGSFDVDESLMQSAIDAIITQKSCTRAKLLIS